MGNTKKESLYKRIKNNFKKETPDNSKVKVFIIMSILYGLVFGLLLYLFIVSSEFLHALSLGGIAITLSYFAYFGFHNPFNYKKWIKVCIIILGTILIGICDYFAAISLLNSNINGAESNGIPLESICLIALILMAEIEYYIGYGIWCKGLPSYMYVIIFFFGPFVISAIVSWIIVIFLIKYIFKTLISIIFEMVKFVLSFFGKTIGDSSFGKGFKAGLSGEDYEDDEIIYEVYEDGYTRKLKFFKHYGDYDVYKDDTGRYWTSYDGGNTFTRE